MNSTKDHSVVSLSRGLTYLSLPCTIPYTDSLDTAKQSTVTQTDQVSSSDNTCQR